MEVLNNCSTSTFRNTLPTDGSKHSEFSSRAGTGLPIWKQFVGSPHYLGSAGIVNSHFI